MKKTAPYQIVPDMERVKIKMGDKEWTPQEISAMVLQKLKADAEERLGQKVEEAVITVPAYFNDAQRQATKDAGEIAGLKVRRIINEPTAAAFAYGFDKTGNKKIAVYDLGGGTFDISILEIGHDGDQSTVEVRATNGDTHLGGDDFDQRLIEWILSEFKKQEGIDLSKDPLALQRIKEAAEKAKIELSSAVESEINQPFITSDANGPKHLVMKLTRAKMEELVGDLVQKTLGPSRQALADSGFKKEELDEVIMVGGMTRMPMVLRAVEEFFSKKPNISVNPDEVVAVGAAIQAGQFEGSLGKDILLLDVTPLSLGIETLGGVMTKLIEKNTTIPTSKSQVFSTAADSQPQVEIHVMQGEREMAGDNKTLGRFVLDGIPPSPRGVPQIEVSFDIDANGILNVSAKDKGTGREQKIRIEASSGLSKDEIEKMKKDAELNAAADKKKRELIEARNIADTMVYTTEKMLKEADESAKGGSASGGKVVVSDDEKKSLQEKIDALKAVKDGEDIDAIKRASEALSSEAQKIGARMYQAQSAKGEDSAKGGSASGGDGPIEGEVVDDKK